MGRFYRMLRVTIAGFIGFQPLMIMPLIVGAFADHQQLTSSLAGLVAAVQLMGVSAGILVLSKYSLVYGMKQNVVVAALLVLGVELLSLWPDSLLLTYMLRFLSGLGGGIIAGCTYSWLGGQKDSDRGFGLFLLVQFVLGSLLLYLLPLYIAEYGVAAVKISFILFALISASLYRAFGSDHAEGNGHEEGGRAQAISFNSILKNKNARQALITLGLFELAMSGVWAYAERIGLSWGIDAMATARTLALAALAGIPGAFLVVLLGSRLGRRIPIYSGALFAVVSLLCLIVGMESIAVFSISMVILNAAWAFTVPYMQAAQADTGKSSGIACLGAFVVTLSLSLGPAVMGVFVDLSGYFGAIIAGLVLLCASVLFANTKVAPANVGNQNLTSKRVSQR